MRDPDDNYVLACAFAAKAEILVSRDKDLLDRNTHQDIPILAPFETLRVGGGQEPPNSGGENAGFASDKHGPWQ